MEKTFDSLKINFQRSKDQVVLTAYAGTKIVGAVTEIYVTAEGVTAKIGKVQDAMDFGSPYEAVQVAKMVMIPVK